MFAPNLKLTARISPKVSGFLAARATVYMTDNDSTYPFKSGVTIAIGLEVFPGPQTPEPPLPQPPTTDEADGFILR